MLSKIRKRFTYANVAMTLALVFAMTGGAYAASKYVITSTKQISPKVLKALTGKPGTKGAAGPSGATGPAGSKGETGAAGTNGKNGTNGTTGFTETLPSEKTETGAWNVSAPNPNNALMSVSFPIPLPKALDASHVHYVGSSGAAPNCVGTVQEPTAEPGNLCVYEAGLSGAEGEIIRAADTSQSNPTAGASKGGALVTFFRHEAEEVLGWGSWAVTAP